MPLHLLVGAARSGKIGVLADRFLDALARGEEPVLVVPDAPQVAAMERELAARAGGLLGGRVLTFEELGDVVAARLGEAAHVPPEPVRATLLRRVAAEASLERLAGSARFAGFAGAFGRFAEECAASGADAEAATRALRAGSATTPALAEIAGLYERWREALDREGLDDRGAALARAGRRAGSELAAWDADPLLVYGFEQLTTAQLDLVEAIAARAGVLVALPYEPGRLAFAALRDSFERLAARAASVDELPPGRYAARESLLALERGLFAERPAAEPVPLDGGVVLLEAAGAQGEADAIASEVATLLRSGVPADEILVVLPTAEAARGALERALAALDVPYALDARVPLGRTAFGHALLALCRFAWLGGDRDTLFAWLRSPASGLRRSTVDAWEGRIRGRGRHRGDESYALLRELTGQAVEAVETLRAAERPLDGLRLVLDRAAPAAFGLGARVREEGEAAVQIRAWRAVDRALEGLAGLAQPPDEHELVRALEGLSVRVGDDRRSGRVRVVSLRRARTHAAEVVIVAGLEEGRLPGRGRTDAFVPDDVRGLLAEHGLELRRADALARERYLFYTAVTRARRTLVLLRQAVGDDGTPREPSPFWEEVRRVLGDGCPPPVRRGLAETTYPLESAPSARERMRSVAALAGREPLLGRRLARGLAPGAERRLDRACRALSRPTRLSDRTLVEVLAARDRFRVTDLEVFAECSQRWFVERVLDPRDIDREVDARMRGSVAHTTLQRFFARLPARIGKDVLEAGDLDRAVPLLHEAIAESMAGQSLPPDSLEMRELGRTLERDLEAFLRSEIALDHRLVPRDLEVSFGNERSAPHLQRGLVIDDFAVSGRIDRVDRDPLAARGLVHDYKYSRRAESAVQIERERKLQLPLYILALRDLLGLEPVGGLYRPLRGGQARGIVRAEAREDGAAGFADKDYLDEDAFWGAIERARDDARGSVRRIRRGDIRHDPRQGSCPSWCDAWPICRVARG